MYFIPFKKKNWKLLNKKNKIIWIVHALWLVYKYVFIALKHENDVSNMFGSVSKLWEFNYCFMKEIKVYIHASYIFFRFVKMGNNNFTKEIKHVLRVFIAWWKPWQSLWEFSTASRVFTDLLSNSPKRLPQCSPGYEGTQIMFYVLIEKCIKMTYFRK